MTVELICGGAIANGWYPELVYGDALSFDPTIPDVHTQATDENGVNVGRVLHVGTGRPREIVVTTNSCTGPRAYVGFVGSYYEEITERYRRLTDQEWAGSFTAAGPSAPDVPWMTDLVVPAP